MGPGPAWPGVQTRGWEPTVLLGTLEELLAGRPHDDDDDGVVSLTDTLRDALAATPDQRLGEVAAAWVRTEDLRQPGWEDTPLEEHVGFLRRLRDLARGAVADGHRLYYLYQL